MASAMISLAWLGLTAAVRATYVAPALSCWLSGRIGDFAEPLGWVFDLCPFGEVGDVCPFVVDGVEAVALEVAVELPGTADTGKEGHLVGVLADFGHGLFQRL